MAKFILFLLAIAVVTASNSKIGGAAASDDTARNLQQRQDAMAEELRLYSSSAWQENMVKLLQHVYDPATSAPVADSETAHRVVSLVQRDMGPLGRILKIIGEMPENSAADVRRKEAALDAAEELMKSNLRQLLTPNDLAQRRQAMAELIRFLDDSPESAAATDAQTKHRMSLFMQREMGPLNNILFALSYMRDNTADEIRVKDEAFDAAMELFEGKFQLLLPQFGPYGFSVMPETTAAEVHMKQEERNVHKMWINDYMGQLRAAGSGKIHDDL